MPLKREGMKKITNDNSIFKNGTNNLVIFYSRGNGTSNKLRTTTAVTPSRTRPNQPVFTSFWWSSNKPPLEMPSSSSETNARSGNLTIEQLLDSLNSTTASTMPPLLIPTVGASVLVVVVAMLIVSLAVHLQYAQKRRIRYLTFSCRSLWFTAAGQGEVLLNKYIYAYRQSPIMAAGSDSVNEKYQKFHYWLANNRRNNPKQAEFYQRRSSLWLPGDATITTLTSSPEEIPSQAASSLRRSVSHYELSVLPKCDRRRGESLSNELTRNHLKNLLTAFQWRAKSAASVSDINRLIDEYAERCYHEGTAATTAAYGIDAATSQQSSDQGLYDRNSNNRDIPGPSICRNLSAEFTPAGGSYRMGSYRQATTTCAQIPPQYRRHLIQGSRSSNANGVRDLTTSGRVWYNVKRFFSPHQRSSSRNRRLYGRGEQSQAGDGRGGLTHTKLLFGGKPAHDITI